MTYHELPPKIEALQRAALIEISRICHANLKPSTKIARISEIAERIASK